MFRYYKFPKQEITKERSSLFWVLKATLRESIFKIHILSHNQTQDYNPDSPDPSENPDNNTFCFKTIPKRNGHPGFPSRDAKAW